MPLRARDGRVGARNALEPTGGGSTSLAVHRGGLMPRFVTGGGGWGAWGPREKLREVLDRVPTSLAEPTGAWPLGRGVTQPLPRRYRSSGR